MGVERSPQQNEIEKNAKTERKESNNIDPGSPTLKESVNEKPPILVEVKNDTRLLVELITQMKEDNRIANEKIQRRIDRQDSKINSMEEEWSHGKEKIEEMDNRKN